MSWLGAIPKFLHNIVSPSAMAGGRKKKVKKKGRQVASASASEDKVVGDVGYKFRKQFVDGWYEGEVVKIRPGAQGGKDRRCVYNDGDSEDLSLEELQALALIDPMVTKKKPVYPTRCDSSKRGGETCSGSKNEDGCDSSKRGDESCSGSENEDEDVQPLAFEEAAEENDDVVIKEGRKSKRKLKSVARFDSNSYDVSVKVCSGGGRKTGHGFACPRCSYTCSYDARECDNCHLGVYYEAGVGAVVLKEREDVVTGGKKRNRDDRGTGVAKSEDPPETNAASPGDEAQWDEGTGRYRRSGRSVKQPRKIDEIYTYEHVAKVAKRARWEQMEQMESLPTPERKAHALTACLENDILHDTAAESTFHHGVPSPGGMHAEKEEEEDGEEEDENRWLQEMAATLGADTSRQPRRSSIQQRLSHPLAINAAINPPSHAKKSDTSSVCSTITCVSVNNPSAKTPPEAVVVARSLSASVEAAGKHAHLPLLSEREEGNRYGCLVYHRNDSRRRVGEVLLEEGDAWVEVCMDGLLKKYRASHLYIVPADHFKAGDSVPPGSAGKTPTPTKTPRSVASPGSRDGSSARKSPPPKLTVDQLFSWFCDKCDTRNNALDSVCHSCDAPKTSQSKRTVLLKIAEQAIKGNVTTVEEAMARINYFELPSIPERVVANLLEAKTTGTDLTGFALEPKSYNAAQYFYWMCGSCTMKNSFRRTTCSACAQGQWERDASPLLKVAEAVASKSKTSEEALAALPSHEQGLVPKSVMDALVTCVHMIEEKNGSRRRCKKPKKDGYDHCEAHFEPILPGSQGSARSPPHSAGKEPQKKVKPTDACLPPSSPVFTDEVARLKIQPLDERSMNARHHWLCKIQGCNTQGRSEIDDMCKRHYRLFREAGRDTKDPPQPTIMSRISAISSTLPSFLVNTQQAQVNKLGWSINGIEDAVLCGEDAAFPLGMKVRKFFHGYGFHDGRITKVVRKLHRDDDSAADGERPVLVYRLKYNDGDQEDLLHSEISSLRKLYDIHNVDPQAPASAQIPLGSTFEIRSGTIQIVDHKAPSGAKGEGKVIVQFPDSSKGVELDLLKLQVAIMRKIGDSLTEPQSGTLDDTPPSHANGQEGGASVNDTVAKEPLLEWSRRFRKQTEADDANDHYDICEGLSLHKRRCNKSSGDEDVAKIPASERVDNPCDVRPGCNVGMWDPAACFNHLSWDPYGSTVCEICGIDNNEEQVVICDDCHHGFHAYCLRPVMVNIPKGEWFCSGCRSGYNNGQLPFEDYTEKMRYQHQDILKYLGLRYKRPSEFSKANKDAMRLFSLNSQTAVKQRAISENISTAHIVFDVGNIKFIRSPHKNDWILPTPLSGEDYSSSLLSMVAAMKYCGMEEYLTDHQYGGSTRAQMNDPSLEIDKITPMSQRNLTIFKAYQHNLMQGVFPPVKIIYDENFGFSVKALATMQKHTIIGEYLGEVVTMEESSHSNSDSLMVLLDTGDAKTSLIIDPTRAGNIARFLSGVNNRSMMSKRKANVRTRRFFMDGQVHVCLFTSRRIEAGEVLNYDYNAGNEGKDVTQWARTGFYDTSNFF